MQRLKIHWRRAAATVRHRHRPRTPGQRAIIWIVTVLVSGVAAAEDVQWEGGVTTVYQRSDDQQSEAELTASADLFARLSRSSGEWLLYIEASSSARSDGVSAFYPTVNGDARSVLTSDGDGGVQISELNYTFFMQEGRTLMVGLIDPSAWLDRSRITNDENQQFLNGSFVNNATIAFPDYTLGGVYRMTGKGRRPELTLVLAGSDGISDLPDRSYQDLLDLTSEGRGVFLGAGGSWLFERASFRVGAWVRTDDHLVAGSDTDTETNYGLYGVYGWQAGANAMNVRVGLANSDVSVSDRFLSFAYQRKTRYGLFGLGVAHTAISDEFQVSKRDRGFDSEIYFRIPVFDGNGHITPSIQYVEVPDIDASETVTSSSATVIGARFHWFF